MTESERKLLFTTARIMLVLDARSWAAMFYTSGMVSLVFYKNDYLFGALYNGAFALYCAFKFYRNRRLAKELKTT